MFSFIHQWEFYTKIGSWFFPPLGLKCSRFELFRSFFQYSSSVFVCILMRLLHCLSWASTSKVQDNFLPGGLKRFPLNCLETFVFFNTFKFLSFPCNEYRTPRWGPVCVMLFFSLLIRKKSLHHDLAEKNKTKMIEKYYHTPRWVAVLPCYQRSWEGKIDWHCRYLRRWTRDVASSKTCLE